MNNNIIFVTISMCGGGTERVISVLANEAAKRNQKVTIMMIGDDRVEYELLPGVEVICVSKATGGSFTGRIKRIYAMRKVMKENGGNVIAMGSSAAIFTLLAAWGLENKVVVSERNPPDRFNLKPISKGMKIIREFLYGTASNVVLQTEDAKSYFGKKVVKKSVIIMNPLPKEVFDNRQSCVREKSVIEAGRLVDYKRVDITVSAFAKFSKTHPEYSLKIFGKGPLEKEIQEQIDVLGISDKAKLCGFSNDMYGEFSKGGMYVSSSSCEGVSNAMMEALALGIPVIATDCPVGGSRLCINDGIDGMLIPIEDAESLAEAMCKMADKQDMAESMSVNAMKKTEAWTVEAVWNKWMELFE